MPMVDYPWHKDNWQSLAALQKSSRMPHALLLIGNEGLGKKAFARRLIEASLCSNVDEQGFACGTCHNCRLLAAGTHPDIATLDPENNDEIKVDDVRAYVSKEGLKPHVAAIKLLFVHRIERMNHAASNSFLKTLEEPVPSSRIIITSNNIGQLPATINSRCQKLIFNPPAADQLQIWLQQQGIESSRATSLLSMSANNPTLALKLNDDEQWDAYQKQVQQFSALIGGKADALAVALEWSKLDLKTMSERLYSWLMDIGRYHVSGQAGHLILFQDLKPVLSQINLIRLNELTAQLVHVSANSRLNVQLLWEDILLNVTRLAVPARR